MRLIVRFGLGISLIAGSGLLLLYLSLVKPVDRALAPANPETSRVELLASGPDALILMPFVTGDVPRLVRGEALQRLGPQLWFTNNTDAGNVIGATLLTLGGLPPFRDIATTFRDWVPLANHTCLTVGCMHWPTGQSDMWGMERLRGLGDGLGPEVKRRTQTFTHHDRYRAAHAAVTSNPRHWFAVAGAQVLQPPPSGFRQMIVSLPTRFLSVRVGETALPPDAPLQAELTSLAQALLEGTGGRLVDAFGTTPMPIWAVKDDAGLLTSNGGSRALPDLAQVNPGLRIDVPEPQLALITERLGKRRWTPPDLVVVDTAVARAFRTWKIDTACLPACGSYTTTGDIRDTTDINLGSAPFWTLDYWEVPANNSREP